MRFRDNIIFSILMIISAGLVYADALVFTQAMKASTIAEYYIKDGGIRLELEVGAADLRAFANLLPDELYEKLGFEPKSLRKRLQFFLTEEMTVTADEADVLSARITDIQPRRRIIRDDITGEPLPVQPEDAEFTVFAVIEYVWEQKPSTLTFAAPGGLGASVSASVGFVVYHDGLPVNDFRYLSAAETLDLNWDDPWYTKFRNRNLRRQYYSPIQGFLYVDHFEVRKEIVLRPKDLQHWIDLGLEGKDVIPVKEQEVLKEKVVDFLGKHCPVTIDGEPVDLELDRINFIRRSLRTTGVIDPPEDLSVNSATLGVIYVVPIEKLPQKTTLEWDLFNDKIQQVPTVATDEAGGLPYSVSPDDPVLEWQNFLKNPNVPSFVIVQSPEKPVMKLIMFLAIICISSLGIIVLLQKLCPAKFYPKWLATGVLGVFIIIGTIGAQDILKSLPSSEKAGDISLGLLKNIYHAFDYRDEGLVYDTLSKSVTGDLLTRIFIEVQDSLVLANQGGAKVKVKQVELTDIEVNPLTKSNGFTSRCSWTVTGSVGHWGHIHQRQNGYTAVLHIEPVENSWKITKLYLENEQRL